MYDLNLFINLNLKAKPLSHFMKFLILINSNISQNDKDELNIDDNLFQNQTILTLLPTILPISLSIYE